MLTVRGLYSGTLMATLMMPASSWPQQSPQHPESSQPAGMRAQQGMGGIASAASLPPPSTTQQKRPITAGGFVDQGPVIFQDVTKAAGLSGWRHKMGVPEKNFIVETNGSGVALLDYDNDGWLDIYLVNGSTFNALDGKEEPPHAALFHNNHDGTFTDVAAQAGVTNDRWGYGVSVADYDNDGWPDILRGQLRQEPPLPQQPRRNLYRRGRKSRRGPGQLVARLGLGRLRWRRPPRSVRHRLCPLRSRQPAHLRIQGHGICLLRLSRRPRSTAARAA